MKIIYEKCGDRGQGLESLSSQNFFRLSFRNCKSCFYNCDNLLSFFHIRFESIRSLLCNITGHHHPGFRYFQGTIALQREKLTKCMGKMMSLCDNMTNIYAKCRIQNEKKNMNLFQLFSVLFSLESTVNCLKSKKLLTKKCPDCEFMVRG